MTYRLTIRDAAKKQMRRLPDRVLAAVHRRILSLREDPRPSGVKKLADGLGWRIRVGEYRVIYVVDDAERTVTIVAVRPRQSAYK